MNQRALELQLGGGTQSGKSLPRPPSGAIVDTQRRCRRAKLARRRVFSLLLSVPAVVLRIQHAVLGRLLIW
jgi:hypothetical protein